MPHSPKPRPHRQSRSTSDGQFQHEQTHGFICAHCQHHVPVTPHMGTANRNHCNHCLWSRHVDHTKGDRQAKCQAPMKPIGLTFKHEGAHKQGEIMLVHQCQGCDTLSINRIAGDDDNAQILAVYESSLTNHNAAGLDAPGIHVAAAADRDEVMTQLFGRGHY